MSRLIFKLNQIQFMSCDVSLGNSFENLETKHFLGAQVQIFPLGCHLGFGNSGGLW